MSSIFFSLSLSFSRLRHIASSVSVVARTTKKVIKIVHNYYIQRVLGSDEHQPAVGGGNNRRLHSATMTLLAQHCLFGISNLCVTNCILNLPLHSPSLLRGRTATVCVPVLSPSGLALFFLRFFFLFASYSRGDIELKHNTIQRKIKCSHSFWYPRNNLGVESLFKKRGIKVLNEL